MPPIYPAHQRNGDYFNDVAKGLVDGSEALTLSGSTPPVTNVTLDIWSYGDNVIAYTPPIGETIDTISSSSPADAGIPILIIGLLADYTEFIQVAILNGQNKVSITPVFRINLAKNFSGLASGTAERRLTGEVFIYEDTAILNGEPVDPNFVKEHIPIGAEISKHAFYTVPAGKSLNLIFLGNSIAKQGNGSVFLQGYQKNFGEVRFEQSSFNLSSDGTTISSITLPMPIKLSEKTDFWLTGTLNGNGVACSALTIGELYLN